MMLQSTVTSEPKTPYSTKVPSLRSRFRPWRDGGRVAGALEVDVGAVAVGQVADDLDRVLLGDVDGRRRAAERGQLELRGGHVERDDVAGNFAAAPATIPSPIGPQPATTTTSSKVMPARSTACSEQDNGSANAAWAGGRSC